MTHPLMGTCNDKACPMHGYCHCGCGRKPKPASQNRASRHLTKGMPAMWCSGHHHHGGGFKQTGIPVEKVRPLLAWLHKRYGSYRELSAIFNIPVGSLFCVATSKRQKTVSPALARKIRDAVLIHKRPQNVLGTYEVDAREIRREWREAVPEPSKKREAEQKRRERARAGRPPPTECDRCGKRVTAPGHFRCHACRRRGVYTKEDRARWASTGYGKPLVFDDEKAMA